MILNKFSVPLIASTIAGGVGIVATHNWDKQDPNNTDNDNDL